MMLNLEGQWFATAAGKEDAIRKLGLPAPCIQFVGKNWFTDDERVQAAVRRDCPAIADVKLGKLAMVILLNPESFWRLPLAGLNSSHPYYPPLLGHVEGGEFQKISAYPGIAFRSVADVFDQPRGPSLPFDVYVLGALLLMTAALTAALRRREDGLAFLLVTCAGVLVYGFATSLLGDGLFDMARHNYLHQTLLPCAALLAVAVLVALRSQRFSGAVRDARSTAFPPQRRTAPQPPS